MVAMLSSGLGYEGIDIGFAKTERVGPLGAVLEQLSPGAIFKVATDSVGEYVVNTPALGIRGTPDASQRVVRNEMVFPVDIRI